MSLNLRGKLGQVDGRRNERIKAFIIHRRKFGLPPIPLIQPNTILTVGWRVQAGQGLGMRYSLQSTTMAMRCGIQIGH